MASESKKAKINFFKTFLKCFWKKQQKELKSRIRKIKKVLSRTFFCSKNVIPFTKAKQNPLSDSE